MRGVHPQENQANRLILRMAEIFALPHFKEKEIHQSAFFFFVFFDIH